MEGLLGLQRLPADIVDLRRARRTRALECHP